MNKSLVENENLIDAQRIAQLGSWERDLITGELFWSKEMFSIFGVNPEEFIPSYEAFISFVHPEDREAVHRWATAAPAHRAPGEIEYRILRGSDAQVRSIRSRRQHIWDRNGRAVRVVGTLHDETERKEIEQALIISQERFRLAMEVCNDGLWEWEIESDWTYFSPAYFRMLGYESDELAMTGQTWVGLLHPDDRQTVLCLF